MKYSFHVVHLVTYSNNIAKNNNLKNTKKLTSSPNTTFINSKSGVHTVTEVCIICLTSALKHRLLIVPRFLMCTHNLCFEQRQENKITIFHLKVHEVASFIIMLNKSLRYLFYFVLKLRIETTRNKTNKSPYLLMSWVFSGRLS